ncbi:UNVERIFIED_CONTAM: hypothetical protein Slati_0883400 [Sesamum latifolium]|uniref:Endonuclease/exonuclease/phosphatase domain-containing protein n=1 Tax=Sesamum latifolium TaxID=2727402 RepID=A0AAW2XMU0_9LAMI
MKPSTKQPVNVFVQKVRTVNTTVHKEKSDCSIQEDQGHTPSLPPSEPTIERPSTSTATVAFVTVVYGDNEAVPRRELWHELSLLASSIVDDPWLVLGDFNGVVDMSEVCGHSGDIRWAMEDFCACILDAGLISLPMQGCSFTWHNCSEGHRSLWKRFDCMLIKDLWLMNWPNAYCLSLTPTTSDHSPLVLGGYSDAPQAGLFRFDNFLARSPKFIPVVQNVWRHHIVGTSMYAVTQKLKALKTVFRAQRKKKGDLALNVKLAAEFLTIAQTILHMNIHNSLLLCLESCCRLIFLKAAKLEQCMLQQRAKMQWLRGGDQCTRAFFWKIAKRRATKRIFQINIAVGDTCTDQQDIINEFVGFFQQLLGGERRSRVMDLRYLHPWASHIITDMEARALTAPVTRAEIKQAFFDIEEDRAPGPDGYSAGFLKRHGLS